MRKNAGNLLLVRSRVLGKQRLDRCWKRKRPANFPSNSRDPSMTATRFAIVLPPGDEVDDVPPPVDADFGFASYHSKTEVKGNVISYTRSFEM